MSFCPLVPFLEEGEEKVIVSITKSLLSEIIVTLVTLMHKRLLNFERKRRQNVPLSSCPLFKRGGRESDSVNY